MPLKIHSEALGPTHFQPVDAKRFDPNLKIGTSAADLSPHFPASRRFTRAQWQQIDPTSNGLRFAVTDTVSQTAALILTPPSVLGSIAGLPFASVISETGGPRDAHQAKILATHAAFIDVVTNPRRSIASAADSVASAAVEVTTAIAHKGVGLAQMLPGSPLYVPPSIKDIQAAAETIQAKWHAAKTSIDQRVKESKHFAERLVDGDHAAIGTLTPVAAGIIGSIGNPRNFIRGADGLLRPDFNLTMKQEGWGVIPTPISGADFNKLHESLNNYRVNHSGYESRYPLLNELSLEDQNIVKRWNEGVVQKIESALPGHRAEVVANAFQLNARLHPNWSRGQSFSPAKMQALLLTEPSLLKRHPDDYLVHVDGAYLRAMFSPSRQPLFLFPGLEIKPGMSTKTNNLYVRNGDIDVPAFIPHPTDTAIWSGMQDVGKHEIGGRTYHWKPMFHSSNLDYVYSTTEVPRWGLISDIKIYGP